MDPFRMGSARANDVSKPFLGCLAIGIASLWSAALIAADFTNEPRFDLRVEHNDNLSLDPETGPDSDVLGYKVEADLLVGIRTPRGETSLRPRVRLQEYPDRDNFERFEGFLDMLSSYEWLRSRFEFNGHVSQQDLYNADTPGSGFDPIDPDNGGNPDSGALAIGQTRAELGLRPRFEHHVTERTTIGVAASYLAARYDADQGATTRNDYDFALAEGYLSWAISPSSDLSIGAYGSRYETVEAIDRTDAVGGRLGYTYRWSETDGIQADINYERNEVNLFTPVLFQETTTSAGGSLTAFRQLEISEWRFTVGRYFVPSGDQGKTIADRLRVQYDRQLSQRLSFLGSVRYDSRSGLTDTGEGDDRDYARADLALKWLLTPTWYIGGGYSYIWEDREQATSDAANNRFFINFGYQKRGGQALSDRVGPR